MRSTPTRTAPGLVLGLALGCAALPALAANVLDLPLGDPARRDRAVPLLLDAVSDSHRGDAITPRELAARLDGVRLLLVGESHTEMEFHRVQLRILEELVARGRKVMIGLEMYPATEQAWLDRWSSDPALGEEAFLRDSRWYRNWGYHWSYYREIFLLAHERQLPMIGLNVPREVVSTMRKQGRAALSPEQARLLPARIDTDSEEHRRLFRALLEGPERLHNQMSDEQFEGMYRAQCTWDGAMAHHALSALANAKDESAILVVLVGSGHVAYGLGVERQARLGFDGRIASLVPIAVEDPETSEPVREARASYADYLWGVPLERHPIYPLLGVSTAERAPGELLPVIFVDEESPGGLAGFAAGDVLVSMDGTPIEGKETLSRLMAAKRWADEARFVVRRDGADIELVARFRRTPPEAKPPCHPAEPPAVDGPETATPTHGAGR